VGSPHHGETALIWQLVHLHSSHALVAFLPSLFIPLSLDDILVIGTNFVTLGHLLQIKMVEIRHKFLGNKEWWHHHKHSHVLPCDSETGNGCGLEFFMHYQWHCHYHLGCLISFISKN
jgi:hypothetical protein